MKIFDFLLGGGECKNVLFSNYFTKGERAELSKSRVKAAEKASLDLTNYRLKLKGVVVKLFIAST